MSSKTLKNHYRGLLAQWYDKLVENEQNDIEFYKPIVLQSKGPILELACGTGRLLIPCLQSGGDIQGLDISGDMLAICQEKLKKMDLSTTLFEQDIAKFKTNQEYDIVFISGGSFQLLENIDHAMSCLNCVYAHLQPGGRFILDLFPLWSEAHSHHEGVWRLGRTASNDRGEVFLCHMCTKMDYENQVQKGHYKYELYKDGRLDKTMCADLNMRWYGRQEFKLMLEKVGFINIRIESTSIMSSHGKSIVYYAVKES